jgi:hypothetical protein
MVRRKLTDSNKSKKVQNSISNHFNYTSNKISWHLLYGFWVHSSESVIFGDKVYPKMLEDRVLGEWEKKSKVLTQNSEPLVRWWSVLETKVNLWQAWLNISHMT